MHVIIVVQRQIITRRRACSTATCAARNVCVSHLELMATRKNALAITTGKTRKEAPNAPS